jgi:hypothetical protein
MSRGLKSHFHGLVTADPVRVYDLSSEGFQRLTHLMPLIFTRGFLFRDEAALEKHSATIRSLFHPIPAIVANVDALIKEVRAGADLLIGVHIRHGDYRDAFGGAFDCDLDNHVQVMRRVYKLAGAVERRAPFEICSDEKQSEETFVGLDVYIGTQHLVEDIYSLAAITSLDLTAPSVPGLRSMERFRSTALPALDCHSRRTSSTLTGACRGL